jgi:hypothetical protein
MGEVIGTWLGLAHGNGFGKAARLFTPHRPSELPDNDGEIRLDGSGPSACPAKMSSKSHLTDHSISRQRADPG